MQFLVYGMIVSCLSFEYLAGEGYAPGALSYAQELVALAAAAVVVAVGVQQRFRNVPAIYWLIFGGLALSIACGLLVNGVGTGPTFAGIRSYLRAIPFFFLPAVVAFSGRQVKHQLLLILGFSLVQLPIALDQRLTTFARGYLSGDRTVGTIMNSGHLSIFLICVASVVFAFYLRRRLSLKWLLVLLPLVLAPTMLNETKATILLVPVALFSIMVLGAARNRLRKSITVIVSAAVFLSVFIPVYDYFMEPRWGYGLVEFFSREGRVEEYLRKDVEVGSYREPGRLDAITVPLRVLSRDPSLLAFGLGIGNVSQSGLGSDFTGEHYQRYGHFVLSLVSLLLWETGLIGTGLVMLLFIVLFVEAYRVSRGDSFFAALALGGMGIIAVMSVSLPYRSMIESGALSYLFWYFAGMIAAERARSVVRDRSSAQATMPRRVASAMP